MSPFVQPLLHFRRHFVFRDRPRRQEHLEALRKFAALRPILRLGDKMAPMVDEALAGAVGGAERLTRLEGEIFAWRDALVLLGSKPDLQHNLAAAFRFFLGRRSPFRAD